MHALTRSSKVNCPSLALSTSRGRTYALTFPAPSAATTIRAGRTHINNVRPASRSIGWHGAPVVCMAGRGSGDPWWLKDNPPNMRDITTIQEMVDALADAGDRLVIVEFYAQWCNACRALFPKICKLIAEKPDVVFLKVNFDDNRAACRTLGIKVLPYFHMYRGAEGRVTAFSCTISKLQVFKDALENFSSPFCSLEPFTGLDEFPAIIAHPELHPEEAAAALARAFRLDSEDEELHPLADTPTVVA